MIKDSKMDFYSIASSRPFTYGQISWITKFTFFRVADLTVSKRPGSSYQIEIHLLFISIHIFYLPLLKLLKLENYVQ